MGPEDRLKRFPLKPAHIELGIIVIPAHHVARVTCIQQRRMRWSMRAGEVLIPTRIRAPVGHAAAYEIQACRDGAAQHVPRGLNVGRPENRAVPLCAQICVTGKNQCPLLQIATVAVIDRSGMEERVGVVKLGAWPNVEVAALWRQVGLGLVCPETVKAARNVVIANRLPIPVGGVRVRRVDVRPSAVIGQSVGGRAIFQVLKPAVLL